MFTIVYDNNGEVKYISSGKYEDNNKLEDYNYLEVDKLPDVKPFRQKIKVINGELTVADLKLTAEQEKKIKIQEYILERNTHEEYLNKTDYIVTKLSEEMSKSIETGNNVRVIALRLQYKEKLEKRELSRVRINQLDKLINDLESN